VAASGKTAATDAFWLAFRAKMPALAGPSGYDVVSFGDSPESATELAELVVLGQKRATAGLLRQFGPEGEPLPVIGGFVVLVDGRAQPRAIWRTTELRLGPLVSVDDAFAWDEGEGDRSRAYWLKVHRAFFARVAERGGFDFHDDIETVFERFAVVWPREIAD
jgi:uncharacterized protein YhfF